jgi:hypothetical protein
MPLVGVSRSDAVLVLAITGFSGWVMKCGLMIWMPAALKPSWMLACSVDRMGTRWIGRSIARNSSYST